MSLAVWAPFPIGIHLQASGAFDIYQCRSNLQLSVVLPGVLPQPILIQQDNVTIRTSNAPSFLHHFSAPVGRAGNVRGCIGGFLEQRGSQRWFVLTWDITDLIPGLPPVRLTSRRDVVQLVSRNRLDSPSSPLTAPQVIVTGELTVCHCA
jgi:hypothetical protein